MPVDEPSLQFDVVHLSTVHTSSDNRIYRKECASLHEAGVAVAFLSKGPAPGGDVPWVELPALSGRLGRMVKGPWHAWRALRRLRPTVLHIHDPELIPLGLLWKRRTGGRVVYDAHEDLPKQVMGKTYLPVRTRAVIARFARGLERTAERRFDAIVAATPAIARNFRAARRVELVQNFPWLRDYPDPSPVSKVNPASACYVGGLSEGRGSTEMTTAVAQTRSGFTLSVAGRRDAKAASDLAVLGGRLIDRGEVDPREIPDIISSAAIGLVLLKPLPNYLESQPTKLFEYMAAGRPFVASRFPYWQTLLSDFNCGVFVDPDNSSALRDTLDSLASDVDHLSELGARGRRALEEHFTFEVEGANLRRLVNQLMSST